MVGNSMVRFLPAIAVLALAIVATWTLARRTAPTSPPAPAATRTPGMVTNPTAAVAASSTASPTEGATHRLAGTVVGDVLYAIVEAPDGSNELYGIDEFVPDVGKLVAVGTKSATFEGRNGRFEMKLVAAPPPTPRPEAPDTPEPSDDEFLDDVDLEEEVDRAEDQLDRALEKERNAQVLEQIEALDAEQRPAADN